MTKVADNSELISSGVLKKNEKVAEDIINSMIENGLKADDRLPSERNLSKLFGVAPTTIRRALAQLEKQGLIKRSYKRGTFVTGKHLELQEEPKQDSKHEELQDHYDFVPSIFSVPASTLTFYSEELSSPLGRQLWESICKRYEVKTGEKIDLLDVSNISPEKVIQAFHPDISLTREIYIEDFAQHNIIQSITDDSLKNSMLDKSYFPTSTIHTWQNGQLYGIPFYLNTPVRLTNSTLCQKHKLPTTLPTNTLELDKCIQKSNGHQTELIAATYIHMLFYQLLSDHALNVNPDTHEFELEQAATLQIIEFNKTMFQRTLNLFSTAGKTPDLNSFHLWNAFYEGKLLAIDTFSYALGWQPDEMSFDSTVQAPPPFAGNAIPTRSCLLTMSATCSNTQQASEFIHFACEAEGQRELAEIGPHIPALQSIAYDDYLTKTPSGMKDVLNSLSTLDHEVFSSSTLFGNQESEHKILTAANACYRNIIEPASFIEHIKTELGKLNNHK